MNRSIITGFLAASSAYLFAGLPSAAVAQTSASTRLDLGAETATTAPPPESSLPAQRLISSFSSFAGSAENAARLVNGLRAGSTVTLVTATAAGATGTNAGISTSASTGLSFTPPTRPMGWGNVRHALTLAQGELAAQGIGNPTPDQLHAALMGGSVITADGRTTSLPGILVLRSQGMGWGQVAHAVAAPFGKAASIQVSRQGSGTVTARGYRAGAVTTASGEIVRAAHWSGEGSRHARIDRASSAPAGAAQSLPVAAARTASAIGLGATTTRGGLGAASHNRSR